MNEKDPKCKRFLRQYEDFGICVNIGERGYVIAEHPNERFTTHYYGLYGSGIFGRVFDKEDPIILDSSKNELVDVQDYIHDKVLFEATDDFHLIGFNTIDKQTKWDGKVITKVNDNILKVEQETIIINFNKPLEINGKNFKKYDYSMLHSEKEYTIVSTEEIAFGLFCKI